MTIVEENFGGWAVRSTSQALSLVAHAALLLWLLQANLTGNEIMLAATPAISIDLVRPAQQPLRRQPPEEIKPDRKITEAVLPKRADPPLPKRADPPLPKREAPALPKEKAGPPIHEISAKDDEWVAPRVNDNKAFVVGARRVPSDYAEMVKGQVIGNMHYPPDALYPAPRNYKGDPKALIQECHIAYEITIDGNGAMLSYKLDPCGNEKLDAAADEALRKSGPFPPPPDQGAKSYQIFGVQIFRKK